MFSRPSRVECLAAADALDGAVHLLEDEGSAQILARTADQWRAQATTSGGASQRRHRSVLQDWVMGLPLMQQTVLMTAVRGPDGLPKYHATKWLLRWYRRCILLSALDQRTIPDPGEQNGGSFTGPSIVEPADLRAWWEGERWQTFLDARVDAYLQALDEVPHHFQLHLMHAVEILGYKHPDEEIRTWWHAVYVRLVHDMHLWPETREQLDARLGDDRSGWLDRADPATAT